MRTSEAFDRVRELLHSGSCDDLRKPEYQGDTNVYVGHCYVASEAIKSLAHDRELTACSIRHEGTTHWFLRDERGIVWDATVEQFKTVPRYAEGVGRGFLPTKAGLSRRAEEMTRRLFDAR